MPSDAKTVERVLLYAESLATVIEKSHSRKQGRNILRELLPPRSDDAT